MGNLFGKSTKGSASAGSRPANGLTVRAEIVRLSNLSPLRVVNCLSCSQDKDHAVLELKRQRDRLHKYKQKVTLRGSLSEVLE